MVVRIYCFLVVVTALIAFPATAHAQAFGPAGGLGAAGMGGAVEPLGEKNVALGLMKALDLDKDGTLSAKEIRAAVKALKTLDANKDGDLTPGELAAGPPAADKLRGKPAPADARLPAGVPGAVAPARRPPLPGARAPAFGMPLGPGGTRAPAGGSVNRGGGLPLTSRQMQGFDKNRDGKVTNEELPGQLWNLYGRFDINRDGILDPIELRRAEKAVR